MLLRTPPLTAAFQRQLWRKLNWTPHPLQEQALLSPARHTVLCAGRRTGKSEVGGRKLIGEAFRAFAEQKRLKDLGKRREFWIVGPEYSDAEKEFRVAWDGLTKLGFNFDRPGSYNNPLSGEMRISLFDGRFVIWAKSAKYPGSLVGEGLSGVVFSEAAKLKPSIYNKFLRPTLADFRGWAYFGSTPEGRNWFFDFWNNGQDVNRDNWASWRAPSWSNPYVYPDGVDEEVLQLATQLRENGEFHTWSNVLPTYHSEQGLTPVGIDPEIWSLFQDTSLELFNQEIAALFTEYVGRVFKDYDEESHVTDDGYRDGWLTYAAADYGFTNPAVWLVIQVDPHGERVHVVDEYYEKHRSPSEMAADLQARGLASNRGKHRILRFFPDPSDPGRSRELSELLGIPAHPGGSIELKDRIEWIRRKLKVRHSHLPWGHPERVPELTIARCCTNMRREMDAYRYKETAEKAAEKNREAPELPMKKDDHTPEALGRFMSGYYGSPWAGTRTRQSKVQVGRRSR